jgi:hypothetical protein
MCQPARLANDHFCDTNIVIGYTVQWSNMRNPVTAYFNCLDECCNIHFSERAIEEARSVIQQHRRVVQQAARLIFEKYVPSDAYSQLEDIKKFVHSELSDGHRGPSDSILNGIMVFIEDNEWLFDGFAKIERRESFEQGLLEIAEAFEQPLAFLESLGDDDISHGEISLFTSCQDDYSFYPEFSNVEHLFPYEELDLNLLFDAFHFLNEDECTLVAFVTNDHRDFVSSRDEIEAELKDLCIHTPDEVVKMIDEESA